MNFLRASQVVPVAKNPPANATDTVQTLGMEEPPEEGRATHPVFLPGESHGQLSLVSYSPWGRKDSDMTEVA